MILNSVQRRFADKVSNFSNLISLFQSTPGICFFVKNTKGDIIVANQAFAQHCKRNNAEDIAGVNDRDLFPASMAEHFRQDDQEMVRKKKPIQDRIELFPNKWGIPEWFITNKIPLLDKKGDVVGIAGTTRSHEQSKDALQPYLDIFPAVEYIKKNNPLFPFLREP